MKFFKKDQAPKRRIRVKRLLSYMDEVKAALATAEKIEDPAEKYLKLSALQTEVEERVDIENARVNGRKGKGILVGATASSIGLGVGGIAAIALSPAMVTIVVPTAMVVGGAMIAGGALIGATGPLLQDVRNDVAKMMRRTKTDGYLYRIRNIVKDIEGMKNTLLKERLSDMEKSPLRDDLLKLPGLADVFAGAAAKKETEEKMRRAENKTVAAPRKPLPEARGYDKLKDPFGPG